MLINGGISKKLLNKLYGKHLFGLFSSILRGVFFFGLSNCGILACLKILIIFFRCSVHEASCSYSLLQHGDLGNVSNKISSQDGKVYFIDFAGVKEENKWILIDILEMVVSRETLEVDKGLFNLYLKKMKTKLKRDINIKAQVRVALLRRTLHLMGVGGEKYRQISREFLLKTLINNSSFDGWFEENMATDG